jgi:hypothetical protein
MTPMTTTTDLTVTCPPWCVLSPEDHENIDTEESPAYGHWSPEREISSVLVRMGTTTDKDGVELDEDALTIHVENAELSLQEADELALALQGLVTVALMRRTPLRAENHAKHEALRAGRAHRRSKMGQDSQP